MKSSKNESGFSMVEVMISASILALIIGATVTITITSQNLIISNTIRSEVEERSRSGMESMLQELRYAQLSTLSPVLTSLPSHSLSFKRVTAFDTVNMVPVLSNSITYRENLEASGVLTLIREESVNTKILCNDIDSVVFDKIFVDGSYILKITITAKGKDRSRHPAVDIQNVYESSIDLRN